MTLFEQFYDTDYERARDKLIPKAVVKANRNFGKTFKKGDTTASLKWAAGWTKCFATTMEELVTIARLRNMK